MARAVTGANAGSAVLAPLRNKASLATVALMWGTKPRPASCRPAPTPRRPFTGASDYNCIKFNAECATAALPGQEESSMNVDDIEQPFDSIESAQDFMSVLGETILDALKDLSHERQRALRDGEDRRAQAIELAQFRLKTLGCYVHKSRRALNDLRTLRRLILAERKPAGRTLVAAG